MDDDDDKYTDCDDDDNYDYDIVGGDNHHNLCRMLQTEFQAVLLEMSRICGVQVALIIIVMQIF